MPDQARRLPIKIVEPMSQDYDRDPVRGSDKEPFVDITEGLRRQLATQVRAVKQHFAGEFQQEPDVPAVARVVLRRAAIAKSYRPTTLFNDNLCPVIGMESLGTLLVSVKPQTLDTLTNQILKARSNPAKMHLSAVESISPYIAHPVESTVTRELQETLKDKRTTLKVRLFRHWLPIEDQRVSEAFQRRLARLGNIVATPRSYGPEISIYSVSGCTYSQALSLASFPGVSSIGTFPEFGLLVPSFRQATPSTLDQLPPPTDQEAYPTVGLIDGGINPDDPVLSPWVVERFRRQPGEYCDYSHGTFIGGLLTHGRRLNHDDPRFPQWQARIFDVVAMPKPSESVTEDDLLEIIQSAVAKRRDIKVWNLSLNYKNRECDENRFSDFAQALDRLQDDFDVQFVISAGNFSSPSLRGFVGQDLGRSDVIAPPAESIRAVTVGALAHKDHPSTLSRVGEPSPFSRRGPGPAFVPKPEVTHFGGNCSSDGDCSQAGILSLDGTGHVQEWVGTSFAAPLVSLLLAHIHDRVEVSTSRNLAKALLIHSAVLREGGVDETLMQYVGYGRPGDTDEILTCGSSEITLVFEPQLERGPYFQKRQFPMPQCLFKNGRFCGEVFMTLVYDPPLHPQGGVEYCQANVEVSLGVYRTNKKGKREFSGEVPLVTDKERYGNESYLVSHCFKYSPVKVFCRRTVRQGIAGDEWRLKLQVRHREEARPDSPQDLALLITIRDPSGKLPVYEQTVEAMQRNSWIIGDLRVRDRVRARVT